MIGEGVESSLVLLAGLSAPRCLRGFGRRVTRKTMYRLQVARHGMMYNVKLTNNEREL